jgi:hypothetical protein
MASPPHKTLVGFARARHLTDTLAPRPLPPNHREPHTISYQCQLARSATIEEWSNQRLNSDRRSQVYIGLPPPLGSFPQSYKAQKAVNAPFSQQSSASSPAMPSSAPTQQNSTPNNRPAASAEHRSKLLNMSPRTAPSSPTPDANSYGPSTPTPPSPCF